MKYPSGVLPRWAKVVPTTAIGTPRTRAVRTDLNENTETFILAVPLHMADLAQPIDEREQAQIHQQRERLLSAVPQSN
jgi:hypothetical protein